MKNKTTLGFYLTLDNRNSYESEQQTIKGGRERNHDTLLMEMKSGQVIIKLSMATPQQSKLELPTT